MFATPHTLDFTLTTPAVIFPAVSLLLIAYTNRFNSISGRIRDLKRQYLDSEDDTIITQMKSLRRRLLIIRNMQWLAVFSLFLSVLSMLMMFENRPNTAKQFFVVGMFTLLASLFLSLREIHLSIHALNIEMQDIEHKLVEKKNFLRKIEEFEI
jgi:hypothetical protein